MARIPSGISRRSFLIGAAKAAGAASLVGCTRSAVRTSSGSSTTQSPLGLRRTVDHVWDSFFDIPMPRDPWQQREHVGYLRVRSFAFPQLHEQTTVLGPDLYPDIAARTYLYTTGRWKVTARNLPEVTIDTIGGVGSIAPEGRRMGFLPRNLMGELTQPEPAGGSARMQAHVQFISRPRANELAYPQQFGYHGVEEETKATITLDRVAAQKVLGIPSAAVDHIEAWWRDRHAEVEQAWWWWLLDEGGDVHVGGAGRLDVRYAFDTPLQMWDSKLNLVYEPATDEVILSWGWVSMGGSMLFSRWITEALSQQSRFETNSPSDIHVDLRIGPDAADMDLDTGVDYALYQLPGRSDRWIFEPALGDVPKLAAEYLDGSLYRSPALPYAGSDRSFDYQPSAWDLLEGETLMIDWSGVSKAGSMRMALDSLEPSPRDLPGRIEIDRSSIHYSGPIAFGEWSRRHRSHAWARLSDPAHPEGVLPWGEPYITFTVVPRGRRAPDLRSPDQLQRVPIADRGFDLPAFPAATVGAVPSLPAGFGGRSLRFDFYDFLDVPMSPDRWDEYASNNYQHVVSRTFPVSYRTTPYFPPVQPPKPFSELASGLRLRIAGRALSEITIDTRNGFLPRDLMGHGRPDQIVGGRARLQGHLGYGSRAREEVYRQQPYWGYYGWENFFDARMTFDRSGAQKILGVSPEEFDGFSAWFEAHEPSLRYAWRQWLYEEWRRNNPMDFFNFPLQIWGFPLRLVSASPRHLVLEQTILNEALDVLLGAWMNETFMPHWQGSYDDLFIDLRVGPEGSDVDVDTVNDWGLSASDANGGRIWSFESSIGSNPYLAHEYRMEDAPGIAYYGQDYTYTPTLWNLGEGEQLNFHFARPELTLVASEPAPADFPDVVDVAPGRVSITGPIDLEAWSRKVHAKGWARTGGLLPRGVPYLQIAERGS